MNSFNLKGTRALLTGSYRGLGAVLALGLAEAGATVILNGRNAEALEETVSRFRSEGHEAYGYAFDITREEMIEESEER